MYCSKCGNQMPDNAYYCQKCGIKMPAGEALATPSPPTPTASPQAVPVKKKSKGCFVVSIILLGVAILTLIGIGASCIAAIASYTPEAARSSDAKRTSSVASKPTPTPTPAEYSWVVLTGLSAERTSWAS